MKAEQGIEEIVHAQADFPGPFWKPFVAAPEDIDGFGHVNNTVYLKWMDATVWAHTRHVGLDEETCKALNRGMAAIRHEIDYLAAAHEGNEVVVLNWVSQNDGRIRASRRFQIIRRQDLKTLLRARSNYVCTNLETGRPARMPEQFISAYPPIAAI